MQNISPRDPVLLALCKQSELTEASVSSDCLQRASKTGSLGDMFCIFQCSLFLIDLIVFFVVPISLIICASVKSG